MRSSLALLPLLLAACTATSTAPQTAASTDNSLYARSFGVARPATLLVVLHGDAPTAKPGYQYAFAENSPRTSPIPASSRCCAPAMKTRKAIARRASAA